MVVGAIVTNAHASPNSNPAKPARVESLSNTASEQFDSEQGDFGRSDSEPSDSEPSDSDAARAQRRRGRRLLLALQLASRHAFERGAPTISELSLENGMTDPGDDSGIFGHFGMFVPGEAGLPSVFPVYLGIQYEPWRRVVSPFVDVSGGGYLVVGRGRDRTEAQPIDWLWGSNAALGVKLYTEIFTGMPLIVRGFGQAFWCEAAFVPLVSTFSGWSFGFGLEYHLGVPEVRLIRKVSHGDGMPEGW